MVVPASVGVPLSFASVAKGSKEKGPAFVGGALEMDRFDRSPAKNVGRE
jgi:hypothetical protein